MPDYEAQIVKIRGIVAKWNVERWNDKNSAWAMEEIEKVLTPPDELARVDTSEQSGEAGAQ